jgi:polyferredoxin
MRLRWLKPLRVAVALTFLAGLTAAFVDFRALIPGVVGHALAQVQFTPALVALGAGGVSAVVVFAAIVVATVLAGRVYCSTVCPLGLLQDAIARLASWVRRKPERLRFARENCWLRYGVLGAAVVAVFSGAGGVAYAYADPYSIFGRIVSALFRPLAVAGNNLLTALTSALGWQFLYRVVPPWPQIGMLVMTLGMLVLLVGLVAWRGRIYCNTLCPVGTVLGLLARHAAWRLQINENTCGKCAACLGVCKAQCIDLRTRTIDASRCVACFNCVATCDQRAVDYTFTWWRRKPRRNAASATNPAAVGANAVENVQRRGLIAWAVAAAGLASVAPLRAASSEEQQRGRRRGHGDGKRGRRHRHGSDTSAPAVSPPGSQGIRHLLEHCTACQLCVTACPPQVLQPASFEYGFAGFMKPRMDYKHAFCNFDCVECGEVCPTGAITPLALADKHVTRIGKAQLVEDRCVVVAEGTDCAACSEHCPTKAVETEPYGDGGNLRVPRVNDKLCIGCGACEYACPVKPVKAITVTGEYRHGRAEQAVDEKIVLPETSGDFPF